MIALLLLRGLPQWWLARPKFCRLFVSTTMLRLPGFAVMKFLANDYWVVHGNSLRTFLTGDKHLLKHILEAISIAALLLPIN